MATAQHPAQHQPGKLVRTFRIDAAQYFQSSSSPGFLIFTFQTDDGQVICFGVKPIVAGGIYTDLITSLKCIGMDFDVDDMLDLASKSSSPSLAAVKAYLDLPELKSPSLSDERDIPFTQAIAIAAESSIYNFDFSLNDNNSFRISMASVLVPILTEQVRDAISSLIDE